MTAGFTKPVPHTQKATAPNDFSFTRFYGLLANVNKEILATWVLGSEVVKIVYIRQSSMFSIGIS